ncbi:MULTISPECIES: phosphoribosylformylglycinamidine synthase subunit PurS [Okeania]|uniref:Phosphoribosylformylglycinamidine synthase subunit PurS n=1 Tax=Okeania hirsuta TaxID=1458930 RepID=A0A3N6N072_9CYAN|nr:MULTISPECIES: phosphoribosylformylglycinamidine synthase subunit PurS [Okeania]NEP08178.1 phosphoribosylformylglycinamidine synthase subunit PurS [Okeania sp. SIO4D6]NET14554.1 phosphoribosylformylglycinamidine synthase subunit PurS [Okeania sp. SIO1H6]NEP74662.1 phosphoribosylformylglycinamidine synthase subunit PurS [Okeania sp. SIO2G5]NEP95723.1 phosphoribosylformylglycinamidine synthase subunit PurS [Okeania sp. SIO2F5]NEQ93522.1 phosphoribosylformylglycinamidine synthase subunit PurS [
MTKQYQAHIYVTLRPSVLDPAGTAVKSGLAQMGYDNVEQIRIGKYIELMLQATDEATAKEQLELICDRLLANPVIENYRFDLIDISRKEATGNRQQATGNMEK